MGVLQAGVLRATRVLLVSVAAASRVSRVSVQVNQARVRRDRGRVRAIGAKEARGKVISRRLLPTQPWRKRCEGPGSASNPYKPAVLASHTSASEGWRAVGSQRPIRAKASRRIGSGERKMSWSALGSRLTVTVSAKDNER